MANPLVFQAIGYLKFIQLTTWLVCGHAKTTTISVQVNIACWNIRRGLLKQELELGILLVKIDSDVMFLTKTDCDVIKTKEDYKLEGYETEIY